MFLLKGLGWPTSSINSMPYSFVQWHLRRYHFLSGRNLSISACRLSVFFCGPFSRGKKNVAPSVTFAKKLAPLCISEKKFAPKNSPEERTLLSKDCAEGAKNSGQGNSVYAISTSLSPITFWDFKIMFALNTNLTRLLHLLKVGSQVYQNPKLMLCGLGLVAGRL